MEIPKLINFNEEQSLKVKEERLAQILKKKKVHRKLAAKFDAKEKFGFFETIVSDRVIYFFKKDNMVDYV
jgi:hypothetical protein